MLWGSVALFVLVMVLLAVSLLRPAWLRRLSPMGWIIAGGLVLPVPVLVALTTTSLILGEQLLPRGAGQTASIVAVASRWTWQFEYADGSPSTENVLHLPAGEPVEIAVRSLDVIHSFWIPALGGKIDAIPGHTNTIRLMADRPGRYGGICAEYCGVGHDVMRFTVEAHAPDGGRPVAEVP
jgi:cytochrome c oxidase subunit 2